MAMPVSISRNLRSLTVNGSISGFDSAVYISHISICQLDNDTKKRKAAARLLPTARFVGRITARYCFTSVATEICGQ